MEDQKQTRNNTASYCEASEARDLASVLLTCYAGQVPAERQGYIATVAALFANYPYEIVKRAVAPWGIPTDHPTYLPTVGEIAKWLDKAAISERPPKPYDYCPQPLPMAFSAKMAELERWREERRNRPKGQKGQYTYAEFLLMAQEGKVKPRPIGRFEEQMKIAKDVMREDKDLLEKLAKK